MGRQRGPFSPEGSPAALVSSRRPAITTKAWLERVYTVIHWPGPAWPQRRKLEESSGRFSRPPPVPGAEAVLGPDGSAQPPADAPLEVQEAIAAANQIIGLPYRYGGGHDTFVDDAYDCSGAVSFALHGGRLLDAPLDSTELESWGVPGPGAWITVYANPDHAFVVVAGLRLDTSAAGDPGGDRNGPRWRPPARDTGDFVARHPEGL